VAACVPLPAAAHLPTSGLGPAYYGILHLLLSPEDLIPLIALALLCGQRGAPFARRALWVVPLAWFAGGVTGMFAATTHGAALGGVSFLLLGALVALNVQVPLALLTALAALFGFFHGYLNGTGINRFADGAYVLLGLAAAVFVVVAVFASLVIPLRRRRRARGTRRRHLIAASGLRCWAGAARRTLAVRQGHRRRRHRSGLRRRVLHARAGWHQRHVDP
jgi:hydrogenase/urease accessory protein HupE